MFVEIALLSDRQLRFCCSVGVGVGVGGVHGVAVGGVVVVGNRADRSYLNYVVQSN